MHRCMHSYPKIIWKSAKDKKKFKNAEEGTQTLSGHARAGPAAAHVWSVVWENPNHDIWDDETCQAWETAQHLPQLLSNLY